MNRSILFALLTVTLLIILSTQYLQGAQVTGDEARKLEKGIFALPDSIEPGYWSRLEKISHIRGQLSRLPAVPIGYDPSILNNQEKKVLAKLVEASRYIDKIFLRQVYGKNEKIKAMLEESSDPLDKLYLHYFTINFGPFDRIDDFRPFIITDQHPPGANFYPEDMTKDEFERWIKSHRGEERLLTSEYTVVKRQGGGLVAVPYSKEYADLLEPAAQALREAAALTDNQSLKKFLTLRAKAFKTNDYYESDLAWVDVKDSKIEIVIGPYEVYEDKLFNYKAAFEAFVVVNRPEDAESFLTYTRYLRDMEANLPLPDKYKNLDREFTSPVRVVQEAFSAGDGKAGVHTSAFVLPNNEQVRKERGCKKVMLKNIMEAKFKNSTIPIAQKIVTPEQQAHMTFEAYFRDTVFHEFSHALGPGLISLPDGSTKDVRECLKENYSSIEECKADTLSLYNQFYLMDRGIIPADDFEDLCVSYLAGLFRAIRFGVAESHGRGALIQFNWMMDKGAFAFDDKNGTYRVDSGKFSEANRSLVKELLEIQATGDYRRSQELIGHYCELPGHLSASLKKLYEIPVDIEPVYQE